MKSLIAKLIPTVLIIIICYTNMNAQPIINKLTSSEKGIVLISAYTANGNQEKLNNALHSGLDAGMSINEIKEVIIQLYAYSGFPRSLNALNTFMVVLDKRKAAGKQDLTGKEPTNVEGSEKYEQGRKILEELTRQPQSAPAGGVNDFAPAIDIFLKEHLFADIFGRGILTYQQRELATISTLASLNGLGSQLKSHLTMGLNVGWTEAQLRECFSILGDSIGQSQATQANTILTEVLSKKK